MSDDHTRAYLGAYSRFTDEQVGIDPHRAVGGAWDEIGQLQFDFLRSQGLEPAHRLLDVGCGTLRAGRHLIRYLDAGHYVGFDISPKAIEFGEALVDTENLAAKLPRLFIADGDLRFDALAGDRYDFVLAQSVFTHLPAVSIVECFEHVGSVMAPDGRFFFTINESAELVEKPIGMDFRYPVRFFAELAATHGFTLADRAAEYPHPRGQRMLEVRAR